MLKGCPLRPSHSVFTIMSRLSELNKFSGELATREQRAPLLFVGHGSPMNGIEDNIFSREWEAQAARMDRPAAILVISAHWLTRGTHLTAMDRPATIHDFGGFPEELFAVQYPAPGAPELAQETRLLLQGTDVQLDHDWGLDHGAWTVLRRMYPDASIPVFQMSIDFTKPAGYHYALAAQLSSLRKKGVMILGSGNMIHNLRMLAWDKLELPGFGYDWALEMHSLLRNKIESRDHRALIEYEKFGQAAKLAIPTPDHYYPLLYVLGLQGEKEQPRFFNDHLLGGSLNMTSVEFV